MTPERFEEIRNIINDHSFVCDERGALAIELIDGCEELRSRLADLEAKNRWVSVKERLPEKEEAIMYWVGCPIDDIPHCGLGEISDAKGITHWRPLPECPEEEE